VIVDELILKLQADLGDIKKSLAQVEAQGKETGKKTGQGFADAFNAIVGGVLAAKVIGFLQSSVTEFNKLEKTLLGLQATAKLTGNSFEALKKSVQTLSSDGVLSIDQASTSMKTLIAQGIQADKAFQLLDAAKKVSSFNNIVGDAGQGVADFVKFLQTGSAELAENMDPSIVKVVKSLGGYAKVSSDATAKQKLINAVIEKGGKLAGDYEKFLNSGAQAQVRFDGASLALSQTLGQKLQPAYNALFATGTKLLNGISSLLEGVSSISVSFGALAILAPVVGLAMAKAGVSIGLGFSAALGPIGLVIGAIAALAAIISINSKTQVERQQDLVRSYGNTKKELDSLFGKIDQLSKINKRTADQERELATTKEALRKKAQELGIDYDNLALKVKNYADQLKILDREAKKKEIAKANEGVEREIASLDKDFEATNDLIAKKTLAREKLKAQSGRTAVGSTLIPQYDREIENLSKRSSDQLTRRRALERKRVGLPEEESGSPAADSGVSSGGGKLNQVRFIEAQDRLKEIEKARRDTERAARNDRSISNDERRRRIDAAKENAKILAETEIGQLRQVYAEFIEDKYQADLEGLKRQENEAIASVRRQVEAGKLDKEKAEKQIQKIREKGIQKESALRAQSMADTMQAANATASGLAQIRGGNVGGGIGATLQGISGFNKDNTILQTIGSTGVMLGAASTLAATLGSIFGESEAERAQAAEKQRQIAEEQLIYLKLQENHQKNQLALMEAAAKTPFETLSRNLRLADIQAQQARLAGGDEGQIEAARLAAQRQAVTETLSAESGKISEGSLFGGVTGSADSLIGFLNERGAQQTAISQFAGLAETIQSDATPNGDSAKYSAFLGRLALYRAQVLSYRGKVPDQMIAPLLSWIDSISDMNGPAEYIGGLGPGGSMRYRTQAGREYYGVQKNRIIISMLQDASALGAIRGLSSEVTQDTGRAESLLSEIERLNQIDLQIAANTKKTAENTSQLLRPDRQRSFIDVGQGFISSLGQRISPSAVGIARSLSQQGLSLPSEIGLASTTSTMAKTLQERMAEAMEMQVRNGARANDLLSGILRATIELYRVMDGNPATVSGFDNAAADAWLADRERRRF